LLVVVATRASLSPSSPRDCREPQWLIQHYSEKMEIMLGLAQPLSKYQSKYKIMMQYLSQSCLSQDDFVQIPPTMSVPGLRDALVKILRDYAARVELQRGCHEATRSDVRILLSTYLRLQALSVAVTVRKFPLLSILLIIYPLSIVFSCGHLLNSRSFMGYLMKEERKMLLEPGACAACSEATRDECVS
uniref:Interleukin-10 n=1 Tax=Angiostrongylus cantonensis TaxID=6313 RepID=A0A0K0D8L9_ANGCA